MSPKSIAAEWHWRLTSDRKVTGSTPVAGDSVQLDRRTMKIPKMPRSIGVSSGDSFTHLNGKKKACFSKIRPFYFRWLPPNLEVPEKEQEQ